MASNEDVAETGEEVSGVSGNTKGIRLDTGILSLYMILQFYKLPADPVQMTREFTPSGEPIDATNLLRAAKTLGLKSRLIRIRTPADLKRKPLPAIAVHKDMGFFIVAGLRDDEAFIQIPGEAPRAVPVDEIEDIWTGELILLNRAEVLGNDWRRFDFTWFIPAIVRYKRLFGEVLAASFFLQLFGLVTPLFFQVVVDKVLVHRSTQTLEVIAIGLISVTMFETLLGGLRAYIFSHTTSRIDVALGARLFRHLTSLPLAYFETRPVGHTVARVRELENVREFLTGSALTVIMDLFFGNVFLVVMYLYSPTLTYIIIGAIPFYVVLSVAITPMLRQRVEDRFQKGAATHAFLVETVGGMETLKAMSVEPLIREQWEDQLASYVRASFRSKVLSIIGGQGVQFINKIVLALVLWIGAGLVIGGELTVGQLIAFNMLSSQINGPVLRLAQLWQDFQQMRVSMERLGDVLNFPTEPGHNPQKLSPPKIEGGIEFDQVSFRYSIHGPEVLRDISFRILPGEVVGIVGRSGSGKSTLAKLMQRLYIPERGRILVDGHDIAVIDPSWLRRQTGVVLQDNILFNRSVRENIALADPAASMERVLAAAKTAGAHEFIAKLSDAYNTILEERGHNLSGGQRQRIAIARALMTDPRVLIFDEATSALDYESERIIQDNMTQIARNRTVIIIAHRLSTVRHADRIFVMDKGSIVEEGRHEELVARRGLYARLFSQQAA